jgi:hypothetical protein
VPRGAWHTEAAGRRCVAWPVRRAAVTMPTEIDITNASDATGLLAAVAGQSPQVITADMTAPSLWDPAGVSALVRAPRTGGRSRQRTAPRPGRLTRRPHDPAHRPGQNRPGLPRRTAADVRRPSRQAGHASRRGWPHGGWRSALQGQGDSRAGVCLVWLMGPRRLVPPRPLRCSRPG